MNQYTDPCIGQCANQSIDQRTGQYMEQSIDKDTDQCINQHINQHINRYIDQHIEQCIDCNCADKRQGYQLTCFLPKYRTACCSNLFSSRQLCNCSHCDHCCHCRQKKPQFIRTLGFSRSSLPEEQGSITFEAALVMPLVIAFLFFFYVLLTAISAQMALQQLASQSAQRLANYIHPVALTANYINTNVRSNEQADYRNADAGIAALVYELGELLPPPLDTIVKEGAKGNYWPAGNLAVTAIGREVLEKLIIDFEQHSVLDKEQIKLVYLQLPDLIHYSDHNVIVALQYDLPFRLPFFGQSLSVREQAMQRVWLPDVLAANYEIKQDNEEAAYIYITSIEPNPLKPGRKATIKATTLPNSSITLEIFYKSGTSIAKHLGTAVSNEQGEVQWTWHVSGNTTQGIWMLQLTLPEHNTSLKHPLEVRK